MVKKLEKTAETIQKKSTSAIVIGILLRLNVSHHTLSKAVGINDRLETICQRHSDKFMKIWDTFHGNRKLFRRDGIHFSEEGMRLFGNLINHNLYSLFGNCTDSVNRMQKPVTLGNE